MLMHPHCITFVLFAPPWMSFPFAPAINSNLFVPSLHHVCIRLYSFVTPWMSLTLAPASISDVIVPSLHHVCTRLYSFVLLWVAFRLAPAINSVAFALSPRLVNNNIRRRKGYKSTKVRFQHCTGCPLAKRGGSGCMLAKRTGRIRLDRGKAPVGGLAPNNNKKRNNKQKGVDILVCARAQISKRA